MATVAQANEIKMTFAGRMSKGEPAQNRSFQVRLKVQVEAGSWSRQIQQHYVGALLASFEDNFVAIRRYVEVSNVKSSREVG